MIKKILSGKIEYPEYLSNSAIDLIKRILVNTPEKRIKICEIKKHKFYLKGKKIFEKKIGTINMDESKQINNKIDKSILTDDINDNIKGKYIKNLFEKNNNIIGVGNEINHKGINFFRDKFSNINPEKGKNQNENININKTSPIRKITLKSINSFCI